MNRKLASLAIVALTTANALIPPRFDGFASQFAQRMNPRAPAVDLTRRPGINWTWANWLLGPTCPDNVEDELEVADLDTGTDAFKKAFTNIDFLMDSTIAQYRTIGWNTGIALGITYNGKVIFTRGAGTIDKDKAVKPTADTIFSIGSITKIFTSRK